MNVPDFNGLAGPHSLENLAYVSVLSLRQPDNPETTMQKKTWKSCRKWATMNAQQRNANTILSKLSVRVK